METRDPNKGVRICIAITSEGLTVYCNKQALAALADSFERLEKSDPKEHYETHVRMQFEDQDCKFNDKTPKNVWVLRTKALALLLAPHETQGTQDFELTFMATPETELDYMVPFQKDGLLPDNWNTTDDKT